MKPIRFGGALALLLTAVITTGVDYASAQENLPVTDNVIRFVNHQIYGSIKADWTSYAKQTGDDLRDDAIKAKVTTRILISDNSQESRFSREVTASFADFALKDGSTEQLIWQDARCHHERGIPKLTLTAIDGLITDGPMQHVITARTRHIGLSLPSDEITPGRRLFGGTDKIGPFTVTRVETKRSRLFLVLKMYTLAC
jgi:hypothetical protein